MAQLRRRDERRVGGAGVSDSTEAYLDDLTQRLHGSPSYVRRVVSEADEHLRDAVERQVEAGLSQGGAEEAALRDFGAAAHVARELNRSSWAGSRLMVFRDVAETGLRLVAVAMVVVGLAGVTARVVATLTSIHAVFGPPNGTRLPTSDCAHWLALHPGAGSCLRAAELEAATDQTFGMIATGVVGVLLLGALFGARRRWPHASFLPRVLAPSVAAAASGAAALGMASLAVSDVAVLATWGAGLWWTCAACSLAASVVAGGLAVRTLPADATIPG